MINNKDYPLKRTIKVAIGYFLLMIITTIYHIMTISFLLNLNYNIYIVSFYSFLYTISFYILMILFLNINISIFSNLYYLFMLILGLYMNLFFSSIVYYFIYFFISNNYSKSFYSSIYFSFGIYLFLNNFSNDKKIYLDKVSFKVKNLKENITICHLTDLHLGANYDINYVNKIVNKIKNERIDLIVITGDLVDGNIPVTKEIFKPFEKLIVPIYYVIGNHEHYFDINNFLSELEKTNIIRISNKNIEFKGINLIGIDYDSNQKNVKKILNNLLKLNKKNLPNVLLYHVPIIPVNQLEKYNITLFCNGHLHGGQMFPINLFHYYKYKVIDGLYTKNNKNFIYCCNGLGTAGPPIRISKAKIGLITLLKDD